MNGKRTVSVCALSALLVVNLLGTASIGYAVDLVQAGDVSGPVPAAEPPAVSLPPSVATPSEDVLASSKVSAESASDPEQPKNSNGGHATEGDEPAGGIPAAPDAAPDAAPAPAPDVVAEDQTTASGHVSADGAGQARDDSESARVGAPAKNSDGPAPEPVADEPAGAVAVAPSAPDDSPKAATRAAEARDASESPVVVEGSTLYANGTAILIKKDADGKTYVFDATASKKLLEQPLTLSTVYGGSKNAPVAGGTSVTIDGVSVSTVYGGGYSDGSGNADVGGDASVTVRGTTNANTVYGGGRAEATKGDASANVSGAATVAVEATPTSNHGNLYGGGYARSSTGNAASATTGASSLSAVGRLYSARGGGSAYAGAAGTARADVQGAVAVTIVNGDAREVYSGGYASGAQASARCGSTLTTMRNTEVMLTYGGGTASAGCADVAGPARIVIESSPNLYGYTVGGGSASNAGSADVASASIAISGSEAPVEEQFGSWVAQAVYAGGDVSGAGSHADVLGAASVSIVGGHMAGNVYGGGSGSSGASAVVGTASISIDGTLGSDFDQDGTPATGRLSVFAAGETDGASATLAREAASVRLRDTELEHLWGVVTNAGSPTAAPVPVSVRMEGASARTSTLACVDRVEIDAPLALDAFLWKAEHVPTTVATHGIATGVAAIVCADGDSEADWFALENGSFDYAVESGASVWRIASRHATVDVPSGEGDGEEPPVSFPDGDDLVEKLLSEEDRRALENGATIDFKVQVSPVDPEVIDEAALEAATAAAAAEGCTIALHLDIAFLKACDGVERPLSTTAVPVRLVFAVPEELRAAEGDPSRTFSVIRIHDNGDGTLSSAVLPDLDDVPETVTVESDAFSLYAMAYADEEGGSEPPFVVPPPGPDEENPGDTEDPNKKPDPKPEDPTPGDPEKKPGSEQKPGDDENPNAPGSSSEDPADPPESGASPTDPTATPEAKLLPTGAQPASAYRTFGVRTGDDAAALVRACGGLALLAFNVAAASLLHRRLRSAQRR